MKVSQEILTQLISEALIMRSTNEELDELLKFRYGSAVEQARIERYERNKQTLQDIMVHPLLISHLY